MSFRWKWKMMILVSLKRREFKSNNNHNNTNTTNTTNNNNNNNNNNNCNCSLHSKQPDVSRVTILTQQPRRKGRPVLGTCLRTRSSEVRRMPMSVECIGVVTCCYGYWSWGLFLCVVVVGWGMMLLLHQLVSLLLFEWIARLQSVLLQKHWIIVARAEASYCLVASKGLCNSEIGICQWIALTCHV